MNNAKSYNTGKQNEADSWTTMRQHGFVRPTSQQRKNLVKAYAQAGKEIRAKGFDLIKKSDVETIINPDQLAETVENIMLFELKTAGRKRRSPGKENWSGLGFTLTGAEKHNAEVLKDKFRFIFLNLKNGALRECKLDEFFSSGVAYTYPTWSVFITKGLTS